MRIVNRFSYHALYHALEWWIILHSAYKASALCLADVKLYISTASAKANIYNFCSSLTYTAAPEMKNHLSMVPSMGAGGRFSPRGMLASLEESTLSELPRVEFALLMLALCCGFSVNRTYRLMSPRSDFPLTSFSQASAHSWMTSSAYLHPLDVVILQAYPGRLTSCSWPRQRKRTGSLAFRRGSCRYGTTRWLHGGDRAGGAQRPQCR